IARERLLHTITERGITLQPVGFERTERGTRPLPGFSGAPCVWMLLALAHAPAPYQHCHIGHRWESEQETCEESYLDVQVLWHEALLTAVIRQNPLGEFLPHDIFRVFS